MKYILPVAIFSILLFSCQPDTEGIPDPDPDPEPQANDSIYIKSVIIYDTTMTKGLDTSSKVEFTYDNQKRVNRIKFAYYEPGKAGPIDYWYDYQWLYHGTDTLPYKIVSHYGDYRLPIAPIYKDTMFLTYTNDMITKDSILSWSGPQTGHSYVWSIQQAGGNKRLITYVTNQLLPPNYQPLPPDTVRATAEMVWSNGNKLSDRDSLHENGRVSQTLRNFDNHPNPFYRVSIPSEMEMAHDMTIEQRFTNNMTRLYISDVVGGPLEINYEYQYRKDGYPVSYRVTGYPLKAILSYAKL